MFAQTGRKARLRGFYDHIPKNADWHVACNECNCNEVGTKGLINMTNKLPVRLIQIPAGCDEMQQALMLLAIERLASRFPCRVILSFLGHAQLDEHNLGFLFDTRECLEKHGAVGVTGLSDRLRFKFAGLNLNLEFAYYRLEAIPALHDECNDAAEQVLAV